MLGLWREPRFDPDLLSSIWVMACRDESPVVTAFSIAYRLGGGITPAEVMELVKGRRELFRLGLTPAQSRAWKERYRQVAEGGAPADRPVPEGGDQEKDGKGDADGKEKQARRQPHALPDWLRVFDDEGPQADLDRVRQWLGDPAIATSRQALERFLDQGFVIDEAVLRSVFRLEPGLDAEPSDLATVNWGLEHLERLRRGRAETRQSLVALTTGIGGVAIGAVVALTAPMVTTIYQGRPLDTNRLTIDHQMLVTGYGGLAGAMAEARLAGDGEAQAKALVGLDKAAAAILPLLPDPAARDAIRVQRAELAAACAAGNASTAGCRAALDRLQALLDGRLLDLVAREAP